MKDSGSQVWSKDPRVMTAALVLPMLLASLGTSIANIALPALAVAFAASISEVRWVVVSYLAALTVSTVVAGRLGDKYGHRRMLLGGLAIFAVGSLLSGIAPSLPLLVGARALQGAGAAFLMTLTMTLLREVASEKGLGRAMGLLGTVSAVGTALGPSLGGALLPLAGWRGIFLVQVPLAALALVMAITMLPRATEEQRVATGASGFFLDKALAPTLAINLLIAVVMMTTLVVGPFYLGIGLGLKAEAVGLVMSSGPLIAILSGAPSGRLVDTWGTQRTLKLGLGMLATGALLLAMLPDLVGVGGYVLALIVLTPGYQLVQAANNTAALMHRAKDGRGTVSGLLALSRNVGLIIGAAGMSAVFAFGVGDDNLASASALAIANGFRLTFIVAAGLMGGAIGIAHLRQPGRPAAAPASD